MANVTIGIGIALIIIGLAGFIVTQMQSWTALIPAFFGIILTALGGIARKESARKMAMHIALFLALLGLIGSFPGLIKLFPLLTGGDVARPAAVIAQTLMSILLLYYLAMGIKSFIDARKKSE